MTRSRRELVKVVLGAGTFSVGMLAGLRFEPNDGIKIADAHLDLGPSQAHAACGSAYSCSGGGGQCGNAYNCSGGGGKCGNAYNCSGGGGKCGNAYNCGGS